MLPMLPELPAAEGDEREECTLADCMELLDAMHDDIRRDYVGGALPWAMENSPDLARRFRDTEAAIDTVAGDEPTRAAFRAAVATHVKVWREISARYRAHREQQAERGANPMAELGDAR